MEDYFCECVIIFILNFVLIEKVDVNKFYWKEFVWGIEWNCNCEFGCENNCKLFKVLGIFNMLFYFKVLVCLFMLLSLCNMYSVFFYVNYLMLFIFKIFLIV